LTPSAAPSAPGRTEPGPRAAHEPLGVLYSPISSRFRVYSDADALRLCLLEPGAQRPKVIPMARSGEAGVWEAEGPGNLRGWSYSFQVDREGITLVEVIDPWALLIRDGRAIIAHDTTPVLPRPALDPADAIIYELHIRDFTRDPSSGVQADWRGRYLGLAESGTRPPGTAIATALDHIVELGVTVVQLMPVHAFAVLHHPEYEWGYMPEHFNAPHPGYAAGLDPEAPIREFKNLVSALHARGLRVTLDVVYNHTAEKWPGAGHSGPEHAARIRSFMALAPREYYRFKDDGTPWDGSRCGNEFRSESEQGRRFIVESCKYWVNEFGVDGFRFDLMGLIDRQTLEDVARTLHAIDPSILLYGEPWTAGPTPIEPSGKGAQRGKGWAVFNDEKRDGLRGPVFETAEPGFLAAGAHIQRTKAAIVGGVGLGGENGAGRDGFADSPLECINYIECHDNHTLVDRLRLTSAAARTDERLLLDMDRLGALIILTSQGIPFLHSGQEFARNKGGHDNTYNLGDEVNNIRWGDKARHEGLFHFYRDVVRLRRAHPMFRLRTGEQVRRALRFLDDDLSMPLPPGTIGYVLEDVTGHDSWSRAALLFNGSNGAVQMRLPAGSWRLLWVSGSAADPSREPDAGVCTVGAHQGAVLYEATTG